MCKNNVSLVFNRLTVLIESWFQLSVKVEIKTSTSQNFRQIVNVKNLDVCAIAENINNFPPFAPYLVFFNETMAGGIHKCPYPSFLFRNFSHFSSADMKKKHGHETFDFPDGLAKRE